MDRLGNGNVFLTLLSLIDHAIRTLQVSSRKPDGKDCGMEDLRTLMLDEVHLVGDL